MKGRTKTQKGITLIALIITIVVLLILAAVAISSITNDGILQYAQNSGSKYNQSVANEQETLNEYTNYLENAGSGNGDGNGSGGTTYTAYTIGQEVKVVVEGVEHAFYVIEDSSATEEKVLLLAKECIDTTNLVQSASAGTVRFSETSYWSSDFTSNPYDLTETGVPDASHYAAKNAYDYGEKVGGIGRLMTYSEANTLKDTYSAMIYGTETANTEGSLNYWLGSADTGSSVWCVEGYSNDLYGNDFMSSGLFGVRPVVEISKDLLS